MLIKTFTTEKTLAWRKMIQKLVVENCLTLGQNSKLTSKKVTRYLIGTRVTTEIFKLYELRYLLLKIYPLIHNLFYNPRLNSVLEKKSHSNFLFQKTLNSASVEKIPVKRKLISKITPKFRKKKQTLKKTKFRFRFKQKTLLPQILFATTTSAFAQIVKHAAQICNMPWHQNRWSNGFMTGGMPSSSKKQIWNFLDDLTQNQIHQYATPKWKINKENYEKTKEKNRHYGQSRWPALIIIPDISNNLMILQEAKKIGLPVMGMLNSHCTLEIDYPVFAQDQTFQSVHFFCCFLATLIAKENVYFQHKRYILQKNLIKSANVLDNLELAKNNNVFAKRVTKFKNKVWKINKSRFWNKTLFFNGLKPIKRKRIIQKKLLKRPSFFKSVLKTKKLSRVQELLLKHTLPHKLFFKFFCLYLKNLNNDQIHLKKIPIFFKELNNFSMLPWKKKKNTSTIYLEKEKRYVKNRSTYFWNVQEKQKIWKKLQHYVLINKITSKQWKTSIFKWKQKFWMHSNYFWLALQQWHNEIKWAGNKHILENIITNKPNSYELMLRQKVGPKWKSKLKSHINSHSYKYVPRNEYLLDQEKKTTNEWINKLVHMTPLSIRTKDFHKQVEFRAYLRKKHAFKHKYSKKKKKKIYKSRRSWYKK